MKIVYTTYLTVNKWKKLWEFIFCANYIIQWDILVCNDLSGFDIGTDEVVCQFVSDDIKAYVLSIRICPETLQNNTDIPREWAEDMAGLTFLCGDLPVMSDRLFYKNIYFYS